MADYFWMQMLYSSSSPVRPISDIFVSIGCSSTLLKQLYCQFSIIILDFVSGKKNQLLSPSCIWIISCQWLYWRFIYCTEKVRQFQIGLKTSILEIEIAPLLCIHLFSRPSLTEHISWIMNSPSPRWKNHGNWRIIFIPWSLLFYLYQVHV